MDLRFEVLLRETISAARWSHYIARRVAGDKTAQLPEAVELPDVKIFNRLGQEKAQRRGKYYDEMTPEQVNKRMRAFAMKAQGKPK